MQYESIKLLADSEYDSEWLLPGHGRMCRFEAQQGTGGRRESFLEAAEVFSLCFFFFLFLFLPFFSSPFFFLYMSIS